MEIIHIVLGQANPNRMNGVNKVVHELAVQQSSHGLAVSIWGITSNTNFDFPQRNFDTVLFKAYKNKFKLDRHFADMVEKVKGNAVFHIHGGFNPTFYSVSRVLRKLNARYVFTPHGAYNVIAMQRSKWVKKVYYSLFEKYLLKGAQTIHCLGQSEVDGLQAIYCTDKFSLAPYGFELNEITGVQPVADKFIIGFCGRIDIYTKGLDLLLDAFKNIKSTIPHAELWLVGDGNDMPELKEMIEENALGESVFLYGSLFGEEKYAILKQFSVFAHPSRNEGLPSAVLEAAAMGIPCVVSMATNLGNAIKKYNAGAVINSADSIELANAMLSVYADGFELFSTNARRMVAEEFNWGVVISQFNTMYNKAA